MPPSASPRSSTASTGAITKLTAAASIRFVYRLAYRVPGAGGFLGGGRPERASRLPILANVVFALPMTPDCRDTAASFLPPRDLAGAEAVSWLLAGPLARNGLTLRKIEVDAQLARIPSEMEPGLGGQAVYLLRVFRIESRDGEPAAVPAPLENTPDLGRLAADPALRGALAAFVTQNRPAIETGVYRLPERFLNEGAVLFHLRDEPPREPPLYRPVRRRS